MYIRTQRALAVGVSDKGDIVYYARIMPTLGIFEVEELKLRTVEEDYFVGLNKHDKRAFLFFMNSIGDKIFLNRKDALNKVKYAQAHSKIKEVSSERYYEEY